MSAPPEQQPPGPAAADGWRHLHPLSPLLRGGIAFAAVLAYVVSQQVDTLFGADREDPTGGHLGWAALAVLGVLVAIVVGAWVSWRFSRFRVTGSMVELRTGLLFRQHRQVPFDRIQAVDIGRPLLARLTGLSEVVVQSAGGKDAHLKLAFLTDSQAQQIREQLMELARHSDEAVVAQGDRLEGGSLEGGRAGVGLEGSAALEVSGSGAGGLDRTLPPGAADEVLKVPNSRILQSVLYSGPSAVVLPGVPVLVGSFALGVPEMVAWLGPMLLATGGAQLKRLTTEFNFTLYHQGDRLRIRHGLTDLRTTSVPIHRIQAIKVSQSLPWRFPGWWRVEVNIAGATQGDDTTQTVVMPVGTLDEAIAVLRLVRPGIPPDAARAALVGPGGEPGFTPAGAGARRLDPFGWRRLGYAVLPDCLMTRRGRLYRTAEFVPHARIQSLAVKQGPLQRSRGLATVRIVSTPGPVSPHVPHLDVHEAERLVNEQVERSSRARQRA